MFPRFLHPHHVQYLTIYYDILPINSLYKCIAQTSPGLNINCHILGQHTNLLMYSSAFSLYDCFLYLLTNAPTFKRQKVVGIWNNLPKEVVEVAIITFLTDHLVRYMDERYLVGIWAKCQQMREDQKSTMGSMDVSAESPFPFS